MTPFDLVFDATDPATVTVQSAYYLKGSAPILVDPLDSSIFPMRNGPINFGANKFVFTRTNSGVGTLLSTFWVSSDGGTTWTAIAGVPSYTGVPGHVNPSSQMFWDGVSPTVTVVYLQNDTSLAFIDFNLTTQAFSTPYGTAGGPLVNANGSPRSVLRRSDGSLLAIYQRNVGGFARLFISPFSGGVWGVEQEISSNFVATVAVHYDDWYVLDPATQTLHVFYESTSGLILCYRQFSSANVLNAAFTFPAQPSAVVWGRPCITGAKLFAPIEALGPINGGQIPAVFVGTPLSVPVWTLDTSVDPLADAEKIIQIQAGPALNVNGVTYLFWIAGPINFGAFPIGRIFVAFNAGTGWSARSLLFDVATSPIGGAPSQTVEDLSVTLPSSGVLTLCFKGQKIYG